jgi:hypothetical protein
MVEKTIHLIDAMEERRLTEELTEAEKERSALQSELNHPTASRRYEAQVNLVNETQAARRKMQGIVGKLRAVRKRHAN